MNMVVSAGLVFILRIPLQNDTILTQMLKSIESVRLLVILADVLGSILKAVVCRCLLLGLNIGPFPLL